jgi:uncharacterized integral membrane protein
MTRWKVLLFLLVCALLVFFALENWTYPNPPVRILGQAFLPLPLSLIIYSSLLIGFVAGWLGHALKIKRERREALADSQEAAADKPPAD